jgi:hypothetical protein
MAAHRRAGWVGPAILVAWVTLLAVIFALTEIQIEGGAGWAANLPTWRIEQHWLLDLFWGGRAMTGYHAGIFSFMALVFHLPAVMTPWSWRLEARILGALLIFWPLEDLLWFVLNPAFGWARFTPESVPWHKHWLMGAPVDYGVALALAVLALTLSYRGERP